MAFIQRLVREIAKSCISSQRGWDLIIRKSAPDGPSQTPSQTQIALASKTIAVAPLKATLIVSLYSNHFSGPYSTPQLPKALRVQRLLVPQISSFLVHPAIHSLAPGTSLRLQGRGCRVQGLGLRLRMQGLGFGLRDLASSHTSELNAFRASCLGPRSKHKTGSLNPQ